MPICRHTSALSSFSGVRIRALDCAYSFKLSKVAGKNVSTVRVTVVGVHPSNSVCVSASTLPATSPKQTLRRVFGVFETLITG